MVTIIYSSLFLQIVDFPLGRDFKWFYDFGFLNGMLVGGFGTVIVTWDGYLIGFFKVGYLEMLRLWFLAFNSLTTHFLPPATRFHLLLFS